MKYEERIRIIEKFGIEGDRFSSYNDLRQIMIVDGNLYDLHKLKKGVLRENILIDDLDINSLEEGKDNNYKWLNKIKGNFSKRCLCKCFL